MKCNEHGGVHILPRQSFDEFPTMTVLYYEFLKGGKVLNKYLL